MASYLLNMPQSKKGYELVEPQSNLMPQTIHIQEVLAFVIKREDSSASLFSTLAKRTDNTNLRDRLRELQSGAIDRKQSVMELQQTVGTPLKLSIPLKPIKEYMVDVLVREGSSERQALAVSVLRAETSEKLYSKVSSLIEDDDCKRLFVSLRLQMRAHKALCNRLYDDLLNEGITESI